MESSGVGSEAVLKLYPDHVPARVPRIAGDMAVTVWGMLWIAIGFAVYATVMALTVISDGIAGTGRTFNGWLDAFRSISPRGVPLLSQFLQDQTAALKRYGGDQLISAGGQAHDSIHNLAVALGLLSALPPILIVCGGYALWRWRDAREMGAALTFVRIAERTGRLEQARALLAYRAVANLSFARLMKVSQDPVGDLAAHRYDALAAEMLKKAGLESFRLYDRGAPELEAASDGPAARVGDESQHQHQHGGNPKHKVRTLGSGDQDQ